MNGINIVFDTCAIIKLLDKQYDLASLGINVNEAKLFTSVIARMELLSKRDMQADEERNIKVFLDSLTVSPIDETIEKKAIEIRRSTSIKLPDCIIVATSIIFNAVLLSDDDNLLRLSYPGLRTQSIFG